MKHNFLHALGFVAATLLALGARNANAQTTANGPYYATPSWDQTLPANTRFILLSNFNDQAVLDRETGLVWQRTPSAGFGIFWGFASASCKGNAYGGRFGWRLPTVQELGSLVDPTATSGPPLPAGHPFTGILATASYWTATSKDNDPTVADVVHWGMSQAPPNAFSVGVGDERPKSGFVDSGFFINVAIQFWCVRGGLQSAPQ